MADRAPGGPSHADAGAPRSEWDERFLARYAGPPGASEGFLRGLPAGYRERTSPVEAAADFTEILALGACAAEADAPLDGTAMGATHRLVVRPSHDESSSFRLRRIGAGGIELTGTLHLLESFGLVVVESVPFVVGSGLQDLPEVHIDDMGLRLDSPSGPEAQRFVPEIHGRRLVEAIEAVAAGRADTDELNRLVGSAALTWTQVMVLRTYVRYWLQTGVGLSFEEVAEALCSYPDVARAVIAYFHGRFDPAYPGEGPINDAASGFDPSEPAPGPRAREAERDRGVCVAQLDLVDGLRHDRVLRAVLQLVEATWRTNYFAGGADGPLVIKLDSSRVPELPQPHPSIETFVHGPTVEGIHLRAGLIARGGLRWSERPNDFRTEILDLALAQVKKNAIIVPTGAKGGFVCRAPAGRRPSGPGPGPEQIRSAYVQFVDALLQVTDNIEGGSVHTPEGILAGDGPDPYLVVAADKGTATFSDVANAISEERGFWLGDAFASGGSRGYDHKAMGITARGAWVAVRRHFRELGLDVSTDPIRVAGVGDMSGDVFGNGMLRSRTILLVGAFDHRHVFLDPDPDAETSFEERRRLAGLGRSSWADYSRDLISEGGGVWSRDAKSVPISAQAQEALGVSASELTPPQLVSAILAAPVDLLWFGGIGTYVKAAGESDTDVGDHANDAVRVTADRVRARVVAEGANLAVTQQGRIRYSRRGGRINADFIDNAAGVATSDREVNIKILLALAIERGRLSPEKRDGYLADAEDEVADEVLRQVDHSVTVLNRAAVTSDRQLDAYEALVEELEAAGRLDRGAEELPGPEEFERRRQGGAGLIRPELATLLAYAKADLVERFETSSLVDDPVFDAAVVPYFPRRIREDFGDLIPDHRLFRQLAATDVVGEIIDHMGVVWAHDLAAETARPAAEVVASAWVARQAIGAGDLWAELEKAAGGPSPELDAAAEAELHACLVAAVSDLTRLYLQMPGSFDPSTVLRQTGDPVGPIRGGAGELRARCTGARSMVARIEAALITAGRLESLEAPTGVDARQGWASAPPASVTPDELLEVLASLDEAVGLEAWRERLEGLLGSHPPLPRLQIWQIRSLLDDLGAWRRRAANAILAGAGPNQAPGSAVSSAVATWVEPRRPTIESARRLAVAGEGPPSVLAAVTLALRRLERVL